MFYKYVKTKSSGCRLFQPNNPMIHYLGPKLAPLITNPTNIALLYRYTSWINFIGASKKYFEITK